MIPYLYEHTSDGHTVDHSYLYDIVLCIFCFILHLVHATEARKLKVKKAPSGGGAAYNSFWYLLNDSEKTRLADYNTLWKEKHGRPANHDSRAVVHLGDNPLSRPCWSIKGHFPSLRKSMGLLWHCKSQSVVTQKELLCLMGWPLSRELSDASSLYDPVEFPDLQRARKYAGNAIHVPTFGIFLLTCLACLEFH